MKPFAIALAATILGFSMSTALAHEYKLGALEISHPRARATPPDAPVSGGYLTIRNTGAEADRLLGGAAAFAGRVEIHQMTMDGDVMQMRQMENGLDIPADGEVDLKPGGYHLMFIGLDGPLRDGETRKVTLDFEKSGSIEVEFNVEAIAKMKRDMQNGGHGAMNNGTIKQGG